MGSTTSLSHSMATATMFLRLVLALCLSSAVSPKHIYMDGPTSITYETARDWVLRVQKEQESNNDNNDRHYRNLRKYVGKGKGKGKGGGETKAPKASSGSGKKGSGKKGGGKKTTTNPSGLPTTPPTGSPSEPLTDNPTSSPSGSPTSSPSGGPTASPTESPSTSPTTPPTNSPTPSPTDMPSSSPTERCQTITFWADAFEVFFGFEQNADGFFEWYPIYSIPAVTPEEKETFYIGQFLNSATAPYPVPDQFNDVPSSDSLQYGIYELDLVFIEDLGGRALSSLAVANTRITFTPNGSLQTKSIQSGTGRFGCASGYQELFPEPDFGQFGFFRIVSTICSELCPPPGLDFGEIPLNTPPERRLQLPANLRAKAQGMVDELPESFKETYHV